MSAKSPKVEDEPGAEERFERGLKNALAMPPKPHKPPKSKPARSVDKPA